MSIPNYTVTPTIYPDHAVNTYKAYATVGGSVVSFLGTDGHLRNVDGGHLYPNHKNAQMRARQLNFPIKHAIKRAAKKYDYPAIEAFFDGYTVVVRLVENEELKKVFNLNIRNGEMPPHYSQDFETIEEVEKEMREKTFFPATVAWKIIKEEGI